MKKHYGHVVNSYRLYTSLGGSTTGGALGGTGPLGGALGCVSVLLGALTGGAMLARASTWRKAANLALKSGLGSSSGTTLMGAVVVGGAGWAAAGSATWKLANLFLKFGSRSGVTRGTDPTSSDTSKVERRVLKVEENSPDRRLAAAAAALAAAARLFPASLLSGSSAARSKAERRFVTTSEASIKAEQTNK